MGRRGDYVNFRKLILTLTIAFSAIFTSMLGVSYAYYLATGGPNITVTTGNIDTGVAVVFNQSQYINVNTGIPISASDVDTLAGKSVFTITPDTSILSGADVSVNISVVDLSVDTQLRVSDFKYKLTCVGSQAGTDDVTYEFSGDGTSVTEDVVSSGSLNLGSLSYVEGAYNNTFDVNKIYTCTFRVWLQETTDNQNSLMNRSFSGLFRVNTMFKK